MSNNTEHRESAAECDSKRKRIEDSGKNDKEHQDELRPTADPEEESQVVRTLFNKRVGDSRYHRTEDSFLWPVRLAIAAPDFLELTGR
jgi:hypothetical protein